MERPSLAKWVSSVFVFLAAFLGVSTVLGGFVGGGSFGLAVAGFVALGAVAIYFLFYG